IVIGAGAAGTIGIAAASFPHVHSSHTVGAELFVSTVRQGARARRRRHADVADVRLGAIGRGDRSNCRAAQDDRRPRAARLTRLPTRTRNIRAAHRRDTLAPGARAPVGAIGVSRALESRKIAPHAIAWADAETDEIGLRTIAVHQTTTPAACRI